MSDSKEELWATIIAYATTPSNADAEIHAELSQEIDELYAELTDLRAHVGDVEDKLEHVEDGRQHRQIAEWLAQGPIGVVRKCKIRCVIESGVYPLPKDILDTTAENRGVFWEVACTVNGMGCRGRARTIDEAFEVSLDWLARAVSS